MGEAATAGGPAPWAERAGSFGSVAAGYSALRPGYPEDVVAFAVGGAVGHARRLRVLDLAAGTGLLTAPIAAAGHDVVAVDPAAGMLAELSARLPRVTARQGRAEAIPLPDADVDVVTAGQAAHWFDPEPAAAEFRRVLRPGGAVGFVWNTRDDRAPWAAELASLLAAGTRDQRGDRPEGNRAVVEAFAAELSAEVTSLTTTWAHRVPPEAVVGRAASSSRVALLDEAQRAAYLDDVRRLVGSHPDTRGHAQLDLDYSTTAWRLVPR